MECVTKIVDLALLKKAKTVKNSLYRFKAYKPAAYSKIKQAKNSNLERKVLNDKFNN